MKSWFLILGAQRSWFLERSDLDSITSLIACILFLNTPFWRLKVGQIGHNGAFLYLEQSLKMLNQTIKTKIMIVVKNKNCTPELNRGTYRQPNPFNHFFANDLQKMFGSDTQSQVPDVNIAENETSFAIELAAPGLTKEDFKIDLQKDLLTVSAEKKEETETKKPNYLKREFNYLGFKRRFQVPENVETANITATYEQGVLKLTLPKKEKGNEPDSKTITIG